MKDYGDMMDPSLNWTCGFSPEGPLECLREATQHGFKFFEEADGSLGLSMMASCDEHKDRMKADYVHPMKSPCGVTGSYFKWPENYCYLDWDTVMDVLREEAPIEEKV